MGIEEPLKSLKNIMSFGYRDWGQEQSDAWIWGIICGWDDDCFEELNKKFIWTDEMWQRLKRLHFKFEQIMSVSEELSPQLSDVIKAEFDKCNDMEAVFKTLLELQQKAHEIAVERHNWVFREYFLW